MDRVEYILEEELNGFVMLDVCERRGVKDIPCVVSWATRQQERGQHVLLQGRSKGSVWPLQVRETH